MNIVRWLQPSGTTPRLRRLILAAIWSAVSRSSSGVSSGSGSFWYSAKNAASSCSFRFMACWMADSSSGLNRSGQAMTAPSSIAIRFAR